MALGSDFPQSLRENAGIVLQNRRRTLSFRFSIHIIILEFNII
jgi:hypothetical protein